MSNCKMFSVKQAKTFDVNIIVFASKVFVVRDIFFLFACQKECFAFYLQ